jgi:AcrR family transcriptional regulator
MTDTVDPKRRKASKDTRRAQLIEATIDTIARKGYAKTTLTEVATKAGLSHGLVNFHFSTKEKLLSETLKFLAAEYRESWTNALEAAPKDAPHQLDAMIRSDFNESICTDSRLAAWLAFWGEAQCRPLYQQECGANDELYAATLDRLCTDLSQAEGSKLDPARVGHVLRVTMEGVWMDLMTVTNPYSRAEAMKTVFTCAAAFFPKHFTEDGLRD